jgi:hypothetical protein
MRHSKLPRCRDGKSEAGGIGHAVYFSRLKFGCVCNVHGGGTGAVREVDGDKKLVTFIFTQERDDVFLVGIFEPNDSVATA